MSEMNERQGYGAASLFLAFLGGAAAGAAVALLMAPKAGRETRERLGDYVRTGKEKTVQLPEAVKAASIAAREAFSETMSEKH
jgi:gas vesicle protein